MQVRFHFFSACDRDRPDGGTCGCRRFLGDEIGTEGN